MELHLSTFLSKTKGVQPAIIWINQCKGYRFGAFLIQSILLGKTGRGEIFIFTNKDKAQPDVFQWTGKNQRFAVVDREDGIGIGMAFKYGNWIKYDFDKGSTCSTNTFRNTEILLKKEDFYIQEIEIWGIDYSY